MIDEFLDKKYKMTKSINFDLFLAKLGVGYIPRKFAGSVTPTIELTKSDETFTYKLHTYSTFRNVSIQFNLDEEFEETLMDGSKVKAIISAVGNKLIQKQMRSDKEVVIVREFSEEQVNATMTVDDVICTRVYTLVE